MTAYTLSTLSQFIDKEIGVSEWRQIDQLRIDQFAACTDDHQWIHVDVARAQESPIGSTIAHGFLTLSLISAMQMEVGMIPAGVKQAFNYGLDKVRFIAPVKAGSRVRNRVALISAEAKSPNRILLKTRNTVEIKGEEKPALIAESLIMLFFDGESA